MTVTVSSDNAWTRMVFSGELNISNAFETLDTAMGCFNNPLPINLDLSGVTEIDAAGLQILLAIKSHSTIQGRTINLHACSEAVTDLLALAALTGFLGEPTCGLIQHDCKTKENNAP